MTVHAFDQANALTATGDGQYTGATLPVYANMVSPFGGVTAATALTAGTVSMTVYFHAGASQLSAVGAGWLKGQARAQAFRNGFFDQTAQVWSEADELPATTHQAVHYKQ